MNTFVSLTFDWRQWLSVTLLFQTVYASAQGDSQAIRAQLAPIEQRATHFVATALSIAPVGLYQSRFPHSDQLDDTSWSVVTQQFVLLSDLAHKRAALLANGTGRMLDAALVSELSKADPTHLAEISTFLKSPPGQEWLKANAQFEGALPRAFAAAAITIASPRRRQALEKIAREAHSNLVTNPPLLVLHAILHSPANELSAYAVFSIAKILGVVEPSLETHATHARQALAKGTKNGFTSGAHQTLMRSFTAAMGATKTRMNIFLQEKELESAVSDRVKDLAERAFLAADQANTVRCRLPLSKEVLREIGIDVGKVMTGSTPVRPGSVEHSWIAMSFERGCHVRKDFSIALRVWEDMAAAGKVITYCKLANYYRLGIGTAPDSDRAEQWREKYKAVSEGRSCEVLSINPEQPWAGLKN